MTCLTSRHTVSALNLWVPALLAIGSACQAAAPFSIVSVLRDPNALARPHDVEVRGSLMFVPGKGGTIAVLDVKDPKRPEVVWSIRHPEDDAQTVLVHGQHLLVGSRDFFSLDVAQPRKTHICERLRDRPRIYAINGMILWDDHVLYANKSGWIGAVDVSRPATPKPAGALNTRERGGIVSPHDIARYQDWVVIVDQRDLSPRKVRLYRVADPKTGDLLPVEKWQAAGAIADKRLNGANRVVVHGHHALIACNKANTLAAIDLRNPNELKTVCVLDFPAEPCGLERAGDVLFAAGGRTIQALDVSNPRQPIVLAAFESQEVFPTGFAKVNGKKRYTRKGGAKKVSRGNAHDLVYQRGYIYVTAQSDDQVAILRVNDPRIRRLADRYPPAFGESCVPVRAENPVTMTGDRRVRPQGLLFDRQGKLERLLYSTDGSGGGSIATALAETADGGFTWKDHPANPVLNRIESDWQGRRAFVTALTRDADHKRWVMATVGDDVTPSTPGLRAAGLWFSEDLVHWKQYAGNPIITIHTDDAFHNAEILPGPKDPPVGMYVRDFRKMDGVWCALVQWRGNGTWSRMTVMESEGDITGPWKLRNLCLAPKDASAWLTRNRNLNWCQPVRWDGRWYAACHNGVAKTDRDNDHIGIVYSEDYFHWQELNNPVTPPLTRPDGSFVVSSQQFLLPPADGKPWRILLGARGVHGKKYMYVLYPKGWTPAEPVRDG